MKNCPVCDSSVGRKHLIEMGMTLTTNLMQENTQNSCSVYICDQCAHTFKNSLNNQSKFYEQSYKINLTYEDQDQLMLNKHGDYVLRSQYQVDSLEKIIDFGRINTMFDYGAGKGQLSDIIVGRHPHVELSLFDFDQDYSKYWTKAKPSNHFIGNVPIDCKFDFILSSFVIEHVEDLDIYFHNLSKMLNEDGQCVIFIPNAYQNWGDVLVRDHIHHFSPQSISHISAKYGLFIELFDIEVMPQAFLLKLIKCKKLVNLPAINRSINDIIDFWNKYFKKINNLNLEQNEDLIIFGAGYYGALLFHLLSDRFKIKCFVDNNKTLQNKNIMGIPVMAPSDVQYNGETIMVGLNPNLPVDVIRNIDFLRDKKCFFISETNA